MGSHLRNVDQPGTHVVVPAHALDSLMPELVVDLVKIDVEGHELAVLKGMRAMLARSPEVKLLFEKLERDNAATRQIAALLGELGLHCYGVGAGGHPGAAGGSGAGRLGRRYSGHPRRRARSDAPQRFCDLPGSADGRVGRARRGRAFQPP
ncbi:FkbM family methyltransferase [Massilia sp. B-10]|nr:FkbM family methyltransferase [Massilia sp. B-10]